MLATRESTTTTPCLPTMMESTTARFLLERSRAIILPLRKNALTSKCPGSRGRLRD